ncbi:MAG TPA: AAA family ATPase [Polyangiaceae bacterium]|nr:AAA family ATPase [Polyangiaceae bacterium]
MAVRFRFQCLVVRHVSGRVTVTPVEHPDLAVHAGSLESALLDLALAFDDRIGRAHPRHLARYAAGAEGEALDLRVEALRVWYGESHSTVSARLPAWRRPALAGFAEVYVPRLGSRFWLPKDADPQAQVGPALAELCQGMGDGERLNLVLGGRPSFEELAVESEPLKLASLRPGELGLDARPFRTKQEQAELDAEDDPARRRQRSRAEEQKRRARERRKTPTLKALGVALHTPSARARLEPAWERGAEVDRLAAHARRDRPAPLVVVAPQGAGKTAVLEALARRLASAPRPKGRPARPVFALDASRLIAGTGGFGEWQAQLQACLEEARRSGAVLLLGRLADLLDAGRSAHSDNNAAQVLAPALAAREVTVFAEATPEDWAAVQRRNASFASVWTPWNLDELSPEAARRVLERVAAGAAARAPLEVRPGVVDATLALCRRFWPYGALVGNAVTFLRRLLAARAHDRAPAVSPEDAVAFFSAEAGIPLVLLRDDLPLDPEAVRAALGARVMAQPQAVERAAQVVSAIKASLQDPRRPAAVLLFAGPTGVGKTELAKALAEFVFGHRDRLVRVDMGEYLGPDALGRLLGEGGSPGLLPAVVRRQPFCVLLLDELEKAHPAVFDALLGVLGEGRLSDAEGRVTDFRNAVIIMTSNLGADTLRTRVGFGAEAAAGDPLALRQHYLAEAQRFFRPEFFNRIDDLIVFRPLGAEAIAGIVRRELERLGGREGLLRRDIDLRVADAARDALAREGLDPRLGARPLKRALERRLAVPAAAWLAAHRQTGPTRLEVDLEPAGAALRFRAESLGRGAEGSRARAEQVLDEAADLRALFGRWDRSAAAQGLRSRLRLLEHGANTKGFWSDQALAEDLSREAALLRDLVGPLTELRQGAEAAEDLAVEAWYDRKGDNAEAISAELAALRERFAPLPRRIYLARERAAKAGVLYLAGPRSAWAELVALFHIYRRWAEAKGLTARSHYTEYIPPEERPKTKPDDPDHAWHWVQRSLGQESYMPAAFALEVSGSADATFLELETGAHRFAEGADSVVRARFFRTDPRATLTLRPVRPLLAALKVDEIRRYSRGKQKVRDFRLDEDFDLASGDGGHYLGFDLDRLHERFVEQACLGAEDPLWTLPCPSSSCSTTAASSRRGCRASPRLRPRGPRSPKSATTWPSP